MMYSILTRFFGPTNTRGARVRATTEGASLSIAYDYSLDPDDNHAAAARRLAEKRGWSGTWAGGNLETGCVWVNTSRAEKFSVARDNPAPKRAAKARKKAPARSFWG